MPTENAPAMASRTKKKDEILEVLRDPKVKTIVLTGDAGVGKTWIAKEISNSAISEGLFSMAFWVFLNERDESKSLYQGRSLLENIARQLSVLSTTTDQDWEDNIVSKEEKRESREKTEEEKQKEESLELERKISDALKAKRSEKKFPLLILDGIPDTMNEDDILTSELKALLQLNEETDPYKVLITTRGKERAPQKEASESNKKEVKDDQMTAETDQSKAMKKVIIEINPLLEEERMALLKERVTEKVKKNAIFETCAGEIAKKSKGLPAAIVVIAEAFNRIGDLHEYSTILEGALEKAAARDDHGVNPLLRSAYDMFLMSSDDDDMDLIKYCWWRSINLFHKHGVVHYHELIAFWILEGCVGAFDRVEEAYKEGHRVLMELIDRHLLKMKGDNILAIEEVALTLLPADTSTVSRRDGFEGAANLGLATVLDGGDWQGFRRITQVAGMIKTPTTSTSTSEKWKDELVSTLLIDGSRLYREVPDDFFKPMQRLQVLVLFNPTFKELPPSLSKMGKLRLLVLRGCDPLENIDPIKELESLIVLEISGAASLKNILDADFFKKLRKLRSLNLSAAQIKSLPSISDLTELRWLILSGCSSLQSLPKITNFTNLEVLDLSGATELKTLEGRAWKLLKKLRMLDVSDTKISRLPILGDLENLATISLSGCKDLARLPKLKGLSKLQVLDLSGAEKLKEFPEDSLHYPNSGLKILHLSQTLITNLPSNFNRLANLELLDLSGARYLVKLENDTFEKLSDCLRHLDLSNTKIENLPSVLLSELRSLEDLNLSGCSALTKIGDDPSFEKMTRLERLNLSGSSKIESLPSLSKLINLRQLLLRNCTGLKQLPSLKSLLKLEQLDLNACSARLPEGTTADFLKTMIHLQLLNLSGTGLTLPSLSDLTNLTNLTQLSLGGCSLSETEPNLGNHTKLKVLDLSEITKITSLPSLGKLSSLRKLKLRGCSGIKQLPDLELLIHLEVLDLFGTGIEGFPYEIFEFTCLKHVDLPDMNGIQKLEWERIKRLPEEVNWVECGILKYCRNGPCISLSPTQLSKLLKDNPDQLRDLGNVHIFVSPPLEEEQRSGGDIFWHRVDPSLRKIYLMNFSVPEEHGLFLEIVGFDSFPEGIEGAIVQAKYVSLIGNKFIKSLSDLAAGLTAVKVGVTAPSLKGCIVEKYIEMETIFGGKETEVKMMENLETLRASNLPKLKSVVFIGDEKLVGGFQNLRELYLDCCPVLEVVFRSSQQPENLEILEIKFCDKLKTMFSSEAPTDCKLQKLRKLHLLELPELTSIGVPESKKVSDIFPSLRLIKYRNCPKMINYLREYREYPGLAIEEY